MENPEKPEKSKAQQRAERRAVQVLYEFTWFITYCFAGGARAAKAAGKTGASSASPITIPVPERQPSPVTVPKPSPKAQLSESRGTPPQTHLTKSAAAATKPAVQSQSSVNEAQRQQLNAIRQRSFNSETASTTMEASSAIATLGIFSHLPLPHKGVGHLTKTLNFSSPTIHPAIVKLGIRYSSGVISGSNARCVALIEAMKEVIADYSTPMNKFLCRDLESSIKPYINFLAQCRPLSVSMGNAIRQIKWLITHTPAEMPDTEAKARLIEQLDHYVDEKIVLAGKAIAENYAAEKINNGDVILTYSCSSLVTKVLLEAHSRKKAFSVVVVDGRPRNEGRELLRRLVRHGLKCSYVHINSISYVMPEVSKVLMGAECLLANGFVMSRVGSSQIALVAKAYNVPVLVCCETYKFCERVQTDSIVHNELGNPDDLRVPGMWPVEEEPAMISRLNLAFDVTPPDMITVVITEIGMVPCTSVPVVLRVKHALIK
ncbi:translation initiation factor eIF-2B subunit delta-like [Paramacrobiotus metropolitanus]|uniref:translation initiation factor eIF-2B subunit delta-like n=1 Tax=Paramacrobiotus metropolitanus TaxID=2943436 RepID=UPI002445F9E1|nr:translation initiation factor eIF-2B subunit delta-like [Paramacrobiotus metropolitanus]